MPLSNIRIFTILGFTNATQRDALIADFLSGDLEALQYMSEDDVKDAITSYSKRTDGNFPIIMTTLQKQRIRSLMLWVKDMVRAGQPIEFPTGTTPDDLRNALAASSERSNTRKEQKKVGESYLGHTFNNKLKSQSQWEKFSEELEATLSLIVGSQGVTLNYVIREEDVSNYDDTIPYEEAIINAVSVDNNNA